MNKPVYSLDYLYDPTVYAVGRLEAVSDHDVYRNSADADNEVSDLSICLNGLWKFAFSERLDKRPIGFEAECYDVSGWDTIRVPGHIQTQGYGQLQYVNVQYPWDGLEQLEPPEFPSEYNPVGSYVCFFDKPAIASGERGVLVFNGVECAFSCWLNGEFIGYSEDSFTPSRFDITNALKAGENKLAVEVYRFTTASWLEDQDFFRFSGIFRDVMLKIELRAHVRDIFVHTDLNDDFTSAELRTELKLDLPSEPIAVRAELMRSGAVIGSAQADAQADMTLSISVDKPLLWSAEEPNLYTLRITLSDNGTDVETAQTRVGFRRFEIKDGLMLLNGKRILFHGVDRHEFCPEHGRALPKELMLSDVLTMKRSNINAVRTSHYPNNSYWYKLCDEYGIYLIDECNLETHGTWMDVDKNGLERVVPGDHPEWLPAVLDRAKSLQERDKNHPSVLIWSCGNESRGGKDIFEMSQQFRKRDPGRVVHYEGIMWDRSYPDTSDIESQMYTPAAKIVEFLEEHTDKPFILCEYAHAMGNSVGAMHKYTELERHCRQYQGGFIWDFVDQAILAKAPNGKPRLGYGGDFGDRPNDGDFSGDGLLFADRKESPKLAEVKYLYQDVTITPDESGVTLENRFLFKNTNVYTLRWRLMRDGEAVQSGALDALDVPAGSTKHFPLNIELPKLCGEYCLHCGLYLREPAFGMGTDYELMHGEAVIANIPAAPIANAADYTIVEGDTYIGVGSKDCRVLIHKLDGGMCSFRLADGQELIETVPALSLFRAPTNNDRGNHSDAASCMWLPASLYGKGVYTGTAVEDGLLRINFRHELPLTGGASIDISYTMLGGRRVRVDMEYAGKHGLPDLPSFGMNLRLPVELQKVKYYGLGPQECYIDRKMGACLGIHEYTVRENITPYLHPQECGAREGVRRLSLTDDNGHGLLVECVNEPLSMSVLPSSMLELLAARHSDELAEPTYTYLDIALKRMGIAGDDGWGAKTHPEYCIPADIPLKLSFVLTAI